MKNRCKPAGHQVAEHKAQPQTSAPLAPVHCADCTKHAALGSPGRGAAAQGRAVAGKVPVRQLADRLQVEAGNVEGAAVQHELQAGEGLRQGAAPVCAPCVAFS